MVKNAVINIGSVLDSRFAEMKRWCLFFQKIYVNDIIRFRHPDWFLDPLNLHFNRPSLTEVEAIAADLRYLMEKDVVRLFKNESLPKAEIKGPTAIRLKTEIDRLLDDYTETYSDWVKPACDLKVAEKMTKEGNDLATRMGALALCLKNVPDVYPLLNSTASYEMTDPNSTILHFTLDKLPVPSSDTPWEQIIDFRNDPDSIRKYYALVHWANKAASSEAPMHVIEDEYNHLYHDYAEAFRLHKMKTETTALEMLISAGLDMITSLSGISVLKTLFSIRKTKIELGEQEMKLPGSEVAYIYKAGAAFR